MSSGMMWVAGMAGALGGFFAGQVAEERHQYGHYALAGTSVLAIMAHAEVFGRHGNLPQGIPHVSSKPSCVKTDCSQKFNKLDFAQGNCPFINWQGTRYSFKRP
jgi:hypothetical protein